MNIAEPIKAKDLQIKSLEEKLSGLNSKVIHLNEIIYENEDLVKQIKSQANSHRRRILQLHAMDEEKNQQISQQLKTIEELKDDLRNIQDQNHKYKYYLESSILKIKQGGDREKNLEYRNNELEQRIRELAVRAGAGFENLTPRPSFTGIEDVLPEIPKNTRDKVKKILELSSIRIKSGKKRRAANRNSIKIIPKSLSKSPKHISEISEDEEYIS